MYNKTIKEWLENDRPSEADNVTKKKAQFMDVKVLDHLIITDQSYFSFADQGRILSFSLPL